MYACYNRNCDAVFDNMNDLKCHVVSGNHSKSQFDDHVYESVERKIHTGNIAFCPQLQKKYEDECDNTILNKFNDYWKQGYAFEITNRNNKKFTKQTKAWLLDQFNKWCKYDPYKKKWSCTNMYSGYDDLIKKFKEKFSSNVWLTERQIKSFFSRARVAAKNKIHEDELDRKKEEWKQELLKKNVDIANEGETNLKRKSKKNHAARKFPRQQDGDNDSMMEVDGPISKF